MWAKLLKPKIWLPIVLGLIVAGILAVMGENDDAPGLVMIGFVSAIGLLFYGAYNLAAESRRSLIAAAFFVSLSAFGVLHTIVVWLEGELDDSPGVGVLIVLISLCLGLIGLRFARKKDS